MAGGCADADRAIRIAELDCVSNQVRQDLQAPVAVVAGLEVADVFSIVR
jgi:hypothetical protein